MILGTKMAGKQKTFVLKKADTKAFTTLAQN